MPEFWTYTPGDFLMYSPRIYARLVDAYQRDAWPVQVAAIAGGVAVAALVRSRLPWRGRAVAAILAAGWAWVAWAFFAQRLATIDWAATYFAYAFAVQALLLVAIGVVGGAPVPDASGAWPARAGGALFLFALFVQPAVTGFVGGRLTAATLAGVLPDPTAVATLGWVLTGAGPARWPLLVIPLLWCAVSGMLLFAMESPESVVMLGAMAVALVLVVAGRGHRERLR